MLDYVINNNDEMVIVSESGSAVLVGQKDWDTLQETVNLLKDEKSLLSLLKGHQARDNNTTPDSISVKEAFYDITTK